jgi:hypothetical protein
MVGYAHSAILLREGGRLETLIQYPSSKVSTLLRPLFLSAPVEMVLHFIIRYNELPLLLGPPSC